MLGSVAVLHQPSGLNALMAAGRRDFHDPAVGEASFVYGKLGWTASFNGLGPTAFYGEYGRFRDFALGAEIDAAGSPGVVVAGSTVDVWGVGVVQAIEAAEMQIYLGYRRHTADFDLVDGAGAAVVDPGVAAFDTIIAGSKIAF